MSVAWLKRKVPHFANLPMEDLDAIASFSFLWSLFEDKLLERNASAGRIGKLVNKWEDDKLLKADLYDNDLSYFRDRYFKNGKFTRHYESLNLRASDMPDLVAGVISQANNAARDRVLAVLLIVWRFRNNLFHGEKWAYWLEGQLNNFNHANAVLVRVLDQHANFR